MDIATVAAVLTVVIAAMVTVITWRQWRTDQARLKHELFDRRYSIYEKIEVFPATIMTEGKVGEGADRLFLRETKLAYFAFGCDEAVKNVVNRLYSISVDLLAAEEVFKGLEGSERTANLKSKNKLKQELAQILESLPIIFTKYLRLGH